MKSQLRSRCHRFASTNAREAVEFTDSVEQATGTFRKCFQRGLTWWRDTFQFRRNCVRDVVRDSCVRSNALLDRLGLYSPNRSRASVDKFGQPLSIGGNKTFPRLRPQVRRNHWLVESLEERVVFAGLAEQIELSFTSDSINNITAVGSNTYFVASTRSHGQELWKLDSGSPAGASLVADLRPGLAGSYPSNLTNAAGTLYFSGTDGVNGVELWRVNGSGLVEMIEDTVPGGGISEGGASSSPHSLSHVGNTLFFNANDGVNGLELWRLGSSGVAQIVEDLEPGGGIGPGSLSSNPSRVLRFGGANYFSANEGVNGVELWHINSSGVAEMVDDAIPGGGINPGSTGSNVQLFTNVQGTLFFRANDGVNGDELWRINSSGIAEMVEDHLPGGGINPGSASSGPGSLTTVNGTLYFNANDGINGGELWRINSHGVAEMVEDSVPGGGIAEGSSWSKPINLTNVAGTLFFRAITFDSGSELWRISSSGIAELVEDGVPGGGIGPGAVSSSPTNLLNVGGTLYFRVNDGTNGVDLWRVNASGVAETVEDAVPGGGRSLVSNMTDVSGTLYFVAKNQTDGIELWTINSSGMAEMVEDGIPGGGLNPGSASSSPANLIDLGGTLFFSATTDKEVQLWKSQGDAANTVRATTQMFSSGASSYPTQFTSVGELTYFVARTPSDGGKLWRTDGTATGTSQVANITLGRSLTNVGGTLFLVANDGTNGDELWRISSAGAAEMVEDGVPGGGINGTPMGGSNAIYFTNVGGILYFSATDGVNGQELWRINSSGIAEMAEDAVPNGGIAAGDQGSGPTHLTNLNGTLFFTANDGINGSELWRINSSGVAEMVEDAIPNGGITSGDVGSSPNKLTNLNGTLFFTANDGINGSELWRINSSGIAEIVEDGVSGGGINPGAMSSNPSNLAVVSGTVFFRANDGSNGVELWRINSSGMAEMVEDSEPGGGITPGAFSSYPFFLEDLSGTLFFTASDTSSQSAVWRVDSFGLAQKVTENISPQYLTNVNGTLYFQANDISNGIELWRINNSGTAELVEDSVPGGGINPSGSSYPRGLTNVGGVLYFRAINGTTGFDLWRISGNNLAELVDDAIPGVGIGGTAINADPAEMTNVNGTLFFTTSDTASGIEVWLVKPTSIANRQVFYNRSTSTAFGNGSGNPVNAIDPTRVALLPGQTASAENYTNYSRGLNGIVVDIKNAPNLEGINISSFQFAAWSTFADSVPNFVPITPAESVTTFPGGGFDGSDRLKIEFANNAIQNAWLRVTLLADANTGLAIDDIFYFGNARFDVSPSNPFPMQQVRINAFDVNAVRSRQGQNSGMASNQFDVDRNGVVNAFDTNAVRMGQGVSSLRSFTAPSSASIRLSEQLADSLYADISWLDSFGENNKNRQPGGALVRFRDK